MISGTEFLAAKVVGLSASYLEPSGADPNHQHAHADLSACSSGVL